MPFPLTDELLDALRNHPFVWMSPERVRTRAYFLWANRQHDQPDDPVAFWLEAERTELAEQVARGLVAITDPDLSRPPMTPFDSRYLIVVSYRLPRGAVGAKVRLGKASPRMCSLCRRTSAETTFRKEAHVIPELFGTNRLITFDECDECNQEYGDKCETHLGNWLLAERVMNTTPAKQTTAKLKFGRSGDPRSFVGGQPRGHALHVEWQEGDDTVRWERHDDHSMTIHVRSPSFRPIGAIRSVARVVWQSLPPDRRPDFDDLRLWIRGEIEIAPAMIHRFFVPGPGLSHVGVAVWERRKPAEDEPRLVAVLFTGTTVLVWNLPDFSNRTHLRPVLPMLPVSPYPPHVPTSMRLIASNDVNARGMKSRFGVRFVQATPTYQRTPTAVRLCCRSNERDVALDTILTTDEGNKDFAAPVLQFEFSGGQLAGRITLRRKVESREMEFGAVVDPEADIDRLVPTLQLLTAMQAACTLKVVEAGTARELFDLTVPTVLADEPDWSWLLDVATALATINAALGLSLRLPLSPSRNDLRTIAVLADAIGRGGRVEAPPPHGGVVVNLSRSDARNFVQSLAVGPEDITLDQGGVFRIGGVEVNVGPCTVSCVGARLPANLSGLEQITNGNPDEVIALPLVCSKLVYEFTRWSARGTT